MSDDDKTKKQLIDEINDLRRHLADSGLSAVNRSRKDKEKQQSDKIYRSLFENAIDAIYLIDIESGAIFNCNTETSLMTGYSLKELKSMSLEDLFPVEEQDVISKILEIISSKGSMSGISGINQRTKDGSLVPVEINAATLKVGKKNYCLAIIRDITEHKRALAELEKSEEKYRALFKHMFVGCALHKIEVDKNNLPNDYVFLEINDAFERLTGLKRSDVLGKKVTDILPDIRKEKPDLVKIYGDVALKGEVAQLEVQFKPLNKWYSVSAYSPAKGYFVSLFDDITHRKYWQEKITESEEKYRRLFENAYDSIFIVDPETHRILDSNETAARRLGYSRDELLLLKSTDLEAISDRVKNDDAVKKINEKGSTIYEHLYRCKDGSEIPVEISSRIIEYGDRKIIESLVRDITDRRQAEENLHESEQRFKDISENALEWIWEIDSDGRYTYSGPLVKKILGYTSHEVIGKYFYDFFHPEDRDELKKAAFEAFRAKQPFREFTNRNIHKNGSTVWLSTSGIPVLDNSGALLGYRGADSDITLRKQAEERLIRGEEEWKATFDTIPDLILITDNERKVVKVNKAMADKLGRKREELIGRSCYEVIHGTKKPPAYCPHKKTISDGKEHIQEIYEDELKGHYLVSSSPIYDSRKNPVGVIEIARDITERKKMEEKLQEEAITDQLTGLFNRRGFHTLAQQQLKLAKRKKRKVSLVYLDLDNMKTINDELGHHEGDNALIDTAHILNKTFRESDLIARIGGDEFAVLLAEHSSTSIKDVIMKNVHERVEKFNESNDRQYTLHLSIGVANYDPDHPYSIEELMEQADILMYEEKKQKVEELNKAEAEYTEKRLFQRYRPGNGYSAKVGHSRKSRIIDISLGGICLRSLKRLADSSKHDINIASPDKKEIMSSGKVVRSSSVQSKSDKNQDSPSFETAFKFEEKNERFKKSLEKLIKGLIR